MRCHPFWAALAALPLLQACAGMLSWDPPEAPEVVVHTAEPVRPERPVGTDEYLVVRGDTLYSIAFRHNLDYREVARWNGIGDDYLIRVGQVLRLTPPAPPPIPRFQIGEVETQAAPDTEDVPKPRPVTAQTPPPVALPAAVASAASDASALKRESSQWIWPTNGVVTRGFDIPQGSKGLDFTGREGQPVFAAASGKVVYSGNALKGYGELIIIKHDDTFLSAYGYNRLRLVKEGDIVTAGQPIAEMGLGPENKPLLHFEIRERGKPVNPAAFLPSRSKSVAKSPAPTP